MEFKFESGAPKKAKGVTVTTLRSVIASGSKPISAKSVGRGVVKVFTTGDTNYYVEYSKTLCVLLNKYGIEV